MSQDLYRACREEWKCSPGPCALCALHLCSPSVLAGADSAIWGLLPQSSDQMLIASSKKALTNPETNGCLCKGHTSPSPWCFCALTLPSSLLCAQTPDGCLQSQPLAEESYSNCLMDNKRYWLCFWRELDVFKLKKQDLLGKIAEDMYHFKSWTGEGGKLNKLKSLLGLLRKQALQKLKIKPQKISSN